MKTSFLLSAVFALALSPVMSQNTNFGPGSLASITTGNDNSAFGANALRLTTTGDGNSAIGVRSMLNNINGGYNVSVGISSMENNIDGYVNVSVGPYALYSNINGSENVSIGLESMSSNIDGNGNVGVGAHALNGNTSGNWNTCVGSQAGSGIGTGSENTVLGFAAGPIAPNLFNSTALGNQAVTNANDQVRIGNAAVTSIGGFANWTNVSDGRFKNNVTENVAGLDFIIGLRPVSYTLDVNKINAFLGVDQLENYTAPTSKPYFQTGFIAQEVEELANDIGFTSFNGVDKPKNENDHYGIRYAEFVVPLVKSVQELNEKQTELLNIIRDQQEQIKELQADAGILNNSDILPVIDDAVLFQNTPNPFTETTQIRMNLPVGTTNAQIIIFNLEGKHLKSYPIQGEGDVSVTIQANELEAGMYIYSLVANNKVVSTKQMILTK